MGLPDDDDLENAIEACRKAASTMTNKRSFRLRVLLGMIRSELEKERLQRATGQSNGHKERPSGTQ